MQNKTELLDELAALITLQQLEEHTRLGYDYPGQEAQATARIVAGKKYTKIDVGSSGKYMVDETGAIFGIKGYGVIHRGHRYGTLATIHEWDWSGYVAIKLQPATVG